MAIWFAVSAFLLLPPGLRQYAGAWSVVAAESDEIKPVIDRVVARMNFLIRGIARSRLMKTQVAFPKIVIQASDELFRIRHERGTDVTHRDLDAPVETKAPDGNAITVRLFPGPPLMQTYESREGRRENTYALSPDASRMTVSVRVSSPRLPHPVEYKLVYRRAH